MKETLFTLTSKNLIRLQEQISDLSSRLVMKYMRISKKLLSGTSSHAIDL